MGTESNQEINTETENLVTEELQKKFDVGIFGWWYNFNYGANLTYFALNRAIQNLGKSVIMLWRSTKTAEEPDTVQMGFARRYYQRSPRFPKDQLYKLNDYCDAFVLGSDQLWNPVLERFTGDQFFFSFADEDKIKLAYAQSFGNALSLPVSFSSKYISLVQNFTKVSVREDYAVETFEKGFGLKTQQVCDPVFLIEPEQYDEMLENTDLDLPEHYVLDFFLNPDDEKIDVSRKIRKDLGIKDYINFTDLDKPEKLVDGFDGEKVEINSRIENLVKAYKNADFVVTDSFHGTCMALIFNKPFISIANVIRGAGRFSSILSWAQQSDRLIYKLDDLGNKHLQRIDFENTNNIIRKAREEGIEWLREGLERKKRKDVEAHLLRKMCTGCAACLCACPTEAITLVPDAWGYYRSAVDLDKCINCGKCVKVCPALNPPDNKNDTEPKCFEFVSSNDEVLRKSTSGGIFPTLARAVFAESGVVVGAAWSDDLTVKHIIIDSEEDLYKLQKSKYLQSYTGNCFSEIKKILESGRKVLFSGTPCQATGLRSYLGKDYDNLLVVDIFCGNAPSAGFFSKYKEETYPDGLESYEFRYKNDETGWSAYPTRAVTKNGEEIIHDGPKNDYYQKVYHKHVMCAYHCQACKYQTFPRIGDLSIGDFWGIGSHDEELDTSKGVSIVLCNNQKGEFLFDHLPDDSWKVKKQVPLEWMGGNGCSYKGGKNWSSPKRDSFYAAILSEPFIRSVKIALRPDSKKKKVKPAEAKNKKTEYKNRIMSIIDTFRWSLKQKGKKRTIKYFGRLVFRKLRNIMHKIF